MQTENFQMSKLALEKEEELEIKLPTYAGSQRKCIPRKKVYSPKKVYPPPKKVYSQLFHQLR